MRITANYQRGPTEKEFMAQVVKLARLKGWKVYHTFLSWRSQDGFPDLLLLRGEQILVAELKRRGGKTTPAQDEWLAAFGAAHVRAFVWTPDSWAEIERNLQ